MPTVPTTFVPQVAPQGAGDIGDFAAPGIAPAENLAAPQVARFGQQLTQTGMAAFRLGSAIQDGIDEAKTKEADVAGGRAMQAVTDKYMAMIGKDAEVNYEAMQAELAQAGESAMGMLDNDVQRRMLSPILARNMGIFQSRMGQHRVQQLRVYQTKEAQARAKLSADYAIQAYPQRNLKDAEGRQVGMIRYMANADTAISEIRKAGELMGYAPESAQMKQLEQEIYDQMAVGIVNGLMAEKDYAQASEFLSNSATVESLDAKTRQALTDSVSANRMRTMVGELATSIKTAGLLMAPSAPDLYWQQKDGPVEPPSTLREALVLTEQIEDPEVRKYVQADLRTQFAQEEALTEQEYNIKVDNILQFLAVPGNTIADLPPDQFGFLRPVDKDKIMSGQKARRDIAVQEDMVLHPEKYSTAADIDRIRMDISPQLYVKLRSQLNEPEKIIEAQVDADDINRLLVDFGMDRYVDPKTGTKDKQASIILRNNIKQMIEVRQRERGGKISPDEKRQIIRKAIVDEAYVSISWASDPRMPVAIMTQEEFGKAYYDIGDQEVPVAQYRMAEQQLIRAGIATPTESQILEYWTRKGKPK
jgi:hypothetical protein